MIPKTYRKYGRRIHQSTVMYLTILPLPVIFLWMPYYKIFQVIDENYAFIKSHRKVSYYEWKNIKGVYPDVKKRKDDRGLHAHVSMPTGGRGRRFAAGAGISNAIRTGLRRRSARNRDG